jgi:hypothetical protein
MSFFYGYVAGAATILCIFLLLNSMGQMLSKASDE